MVWPFSRDSGGGGALIGLPGMYFISVAVTGYPFEQFSKGFIFTSALLNPARYFLKAGIFRLLLKLALIGY